MLLQKTIKDNKFQSLRFLYRKSKTEYKENYQ